VTRQGGTATSYRASYATGGSFSRYFQLDRRQLRYRQQQWPTLGWIIGELRWYAIGITAGAIAAAALAIASA
jgi:hypothetical protein